MSLKERVFLVSGCFWLAACSGGDSGANAAGAGGNGAIVNGTGGAAQSVGGGTGVAGVTGAGGTTGSSGATSTGGSTVISGGGTTGTGGIGAIGGSTASGGSSNTGGGGASSAGAGSAGASSGGASNGGASGSAGSTGAGGSGPGMCCSDGKCLCHGDAPTALTSSKGPYTTQSYTVSGAGCVYYPTNAEPPFAAVSIADGFSGSGGCNSVQTGQWGPLYASWGIVAMIVNTGASDQPATRGMALSHGIEAFKAENTKMGSPLNGKLAGRYGTSGFSMGGGGTTYAARDDSTLLSNVAIMAWGPVNSGIKVPSLFICGSSDTLAGCGSMGTPAYAGIPDTIPKMRVTVSSGHNGQPTAGSGKSGQFGLAFQKVFLEGDERWRPLLTGAMVDETNIK